MAYRTHPEDQERERDEHDSSRERFDHELAARERIVEHGSVPVEDPAVERLARSMAEPRRPQLREINGDGVTSDPDVPAAMAVLALSERTLRGMRREITARLAEIPLGGEEGRRLGALSRAVRTELERRAAAAGTPRRAA
jgi:hypothetical protein